MPFAIEVPPYAGGSFGVTHTDDGLLRWFRDTHNVWSMLDVGCGPGGQVTVAKILGMRAIGLEVDPTYYRAIGVALINLCDQPVLLPARADLVWSVEVAEHIPDECIDRYIETLTKNARIAIVMTASQVQAPQHVSVHPVNWWVNRVEASGEWRLEKNSRAIIDRYSTMDREFLHDTGMIFWRTTT